MEDEAPAPSVAEKLEELKLDDAELNLGDKKKKKKKKVVLNDADGMLGEPGADDDAPELALGAKKKKKKKSRAREEGEFDEAAGPDAAADGDGNDANNTATGSGLPWDDDPSRDYKYEELLDRVFGILRQQNPSLTGRASRFLLKPPQVAREGTKKTVFTNFPELCRAMNRGQEHCMAFLLAELGVQGNLDGQQRLIVKGRFLPKGFENVIRRYMNEYVLCASCKAPDTLLDRDAGTRIMFLRCQQCGASRTVAPIKAGFVARTTRRPKA